MKKLLKNKVFRITVIIALVFVLLLLSVLGISTVRRTVRNALGHIFPDRYPRYVYYVNNVAQDTVSETDFLLKDVREVQINSEKSYLMRQKGYCIFKYLWYNIRV